MLYKPHPKDKVRLEIVECQKRIDMFEMIAEGYRKKLKRLENDRRNPKK